ncbi:MAG: NAD(P)H-hydrate epimerase [Sphingobacteriaceae bacterium]|nr:NAD(P)H-hydrate epimerase [Sphingobacteriaceae bacterium]
MCYLLPKIPSLILVENVALEIFHFITDANFQFRINPSVGIICGKGNNGDGFAVARHLSNAGFNVKVLHTHLPDQMSAIVESISKFYKI